jgi:hypothetical protein
MLEKREKPFTDLITRIYSCADTAQAFSDWDTDSGQITKILVTLGD